MAETIPPSTGLSITTGNEIKNKGIILAGVLFIFFTILSIVSLIAYWPDKMPGLNEKALYKNAWFHVCLLNSNNSCESCTQKSIPSFSESDSLKIDSIVNVLTDTSHVDYNNISDSLKQVKKTADSIKISDSLFKSSMLQKPEPRQCIDIIGLNTLLLLLVAIAGFMGTMIHITTSFANFIGSEKFKKSWMLWYIVKPFIGAALALVLYFVFRAGLLNFNDTSNINLYGIITMAAFAGLFTDKATMKLAEVFDVIFKTTDPRTGKTDERPDKLNTDEVNLKITGIKPENLTASSDNKLIISGEGLDKRKITVKINNEEIQNPVIKNDSISLTYKIPDGSEQTEFVLQVLDEKGNEIYSSKLTKANIASATENKIVDEKNPEDTIAKQQDSSSAVSNTNPEEVDDENSSDENNLKG